MKKLALLFVSIFAIFLSSCMNVGTKAMKSEDFETKSFELEAFNSISVEEGIDVVLHKASEHRAVATSNFMEYLVVEVEDGTLRIRFEKPSFTNLMNDKTKVEVWGVDVSEFRASSSGQLVVDGQFRGSEQSIKASSSGDVEYDVTAQNVTINVSSSGGYEGIVRAENLEASASSSGDIKMKGSADYANLKASSSGDIRGKNLTAGVVDAKASSSGDITVFVSEELNARASSSGDIHYLTDKEILLEVSESSSGDVTRIE